MPADSVCEGGLVLDMSGFRTITIADDKNSARIGGGMLCGEVEIATAGLETATVLGQCPSVGVGGFLLGGGVSPLMSKYGLGCAISSQLSLCLPTEAGRGQARRRTLIFIGPSVAVAAILASSLRSKWRCTPFPRSTPEFSRFSQTTRASFCRPSAVSSKRARRPHTHCPRLRRT